MSISICPVLGFSGSLFLTVVFAAVLQDFADARGLIRAPPCLFFFISSLSFISSSCSGKSKSPGERVARGSQAGARSAGRAGHRSMSSLPCRTWPTRTRITHLIPRTRDLMIGKPNINMALGSASSGTPPHFPGAESISSPVCSSAALFASARVLARDMGGLPKTT